MSSSGPTESRFARIPARIARDLKTVRLLRNWPEFLRAELRREPVTRVRLRNGVIIDAPAALDLEFLFTEIWLWEVYTPRDYQIREGDTVVDIGANIGVFSTYAATRAPGVRVFAYEPFPDSVDWLRRNVAASRLANIRVTPKAVAGGVETRVLQVQTDQWVMHSLASDGSPERGPDSAGVAVQCIGLDDVVREQSIERCDLLKLDCEGSEYEILESCSPETLARVQKITAEFHEGPGIEGTGAGLRDFLRSRGFTVDVFESTGGGAGHICARRR